MMCLFSNNSCKSLDNEKIKQIYEQDINQFIHNICSMCIKNRYARAKERASKKRYVVVNTL